jgi:hypothetical protein
MDILEEDDSFLTTMEIFFAFMVFFEDRFGI